MKKLFFGIALLSIGTSSIFAQAPGRKECCETKAVECAVAERCDARGVEECMMFEGITLTPEQKTKIEALCGECNVPGKERLKGKKAKLTPEEMKQIRAQRSEKHQQEKKNYLAKMKGILTPEQYVVFLENSFTMPGGRQNGFKMNRPMDKKFKKQGLHKMQGEKIVKEKK